MYLNHICKFVNSGSTVHFWSSWFTGTVLYQMETGFTMSVAVSLRFSLQWSGITIKPQKMNNFWGTEGPCVQIAVILCSISLSFSYLMIFFVFRKALPALEKEYNFWMTNRSVVVAVNGTNYTLNHYNVQVDGPRWSLFEQLKYD